MKATVIITHLKSSNTGTYNFATELEAKNFFFNRKNTIDDMVEIDQNTARGGVYKIELT